MAIDRMDWHNGAEDFPKDLPPEAGGTHIGMFLCWIINNNLEGHLHKTDSKESISKVRSRVMSGTEFLIKECDEKLWEEDIEAECLDFVKHYYESNKYYSDYEKALVANEPSIYHVQDNWENFDKLAPYIDLAFDKWQASKNKKWWQLWR